MSEDQYWALIEYYGSWAIATISIFIMGYEIYIWKRFLPDIREPMFIALIVLAFALGAANLIVLTIGGVNAFSDNPFYQVKPMIWISRYRLWANVLPLPIIAGLMHTVNIRTKKLTSSGLAVVVDGVTAIAYSESKMREAQTIRLYSEEYLLHRT